MYVCRPEPPREDTARLEAFITKSLPRESSCHIFLASRSFILVTLGLYRFVSLGESSPREKQYSSIMQERANTQTILFSSSSNIRLNFSKCSLRRSRINVESVSFLSILYFLLFECIIQANHKGQFCIFIYSSFIRSFFVVGEN